MAYDLGNLSNVTNYLSNYQGYKPTNGSMGMPSQGWDGWNNYNSTNTYGGTPTSNTPPGGVPSLQTSVGGVSSPPIRTGGGLMGNINRGGRNAPPITMLPNPKQDYQTQFQSLFHPLIQARNNYPIGSPMRQNYDNYLQQHVQPLMKQSQWNGMGTTPSMPNVPQYNPSQMYGGLNQMIGSMQNGSNQGG